MIGGHCFFSFNASGCFIVSLLKNRKTIFPGVKKADAITAASSEGARETHPVRQSDLFRPVLKSDILRRNSPSQRTATFCIIAYQLIVFRAYLPHFPQSCLIIIPHKALYCKGFRNIFSKTFVIKIDPLYIYGYFSQNADKIEGFRKKKFFCFFRRNRKSTQCKLRLTDCKL